MQVASTSEETTTLVARCRKGNEVIGNLWGRACQVVNDDVAWADAMELYHRATVKLSHLCLRLQALGYTSCLYEEPRCRGTRDLVCFGCPSKTPYWRENARCSRKGVNYDKER